jgi:hypothetical protein
VTDHSCQDLKLLLTLGKADKSRYKLQRGERYCFAYDTFVTGKGETLIVSTISDQYCYKILLCV